jgi:hypothetical protein
MRRLHSETILANSMLEDGTKDVDQTMAGKDYSCTRAFEFSRMILRNGDWLTRRALRAEFEERKSLALSNSTVMPWIAKVAPKSPGLLSK